MIISYQTCFPVFTLVWYFFVPIEIIWNLLKKNFSIAVGGHNKLFISLCKVLEKDYFMKKVPNFSCSNYQKVPNVYLSFVISMFIVLKDTYSRKKKPKYSYSRFHPEKFWISKSKAEDFVCIYISFKDIMLPNLAILTPLTFEFLSGSTFCRLVTR